MVKTIAFAEICTLGSCQCELTSDVVAIGGCASTSTVDVRGHEVELLAVLVRDYGASSGSGIGSQNNTTLKKEKEIRVSLGKNSMGWQT